MSRKVKRINQPQPLRPLGSLIFYTVAASAAVVGLVAYGSGVSIETALARSVLVVLICTLAGSGINIALALSVNNQHLGPVIENDMSAEAPASSLENV